MSKPSNLNLSLFQKNLVIGENHSNIVAKKFLIENMKALKAQGYNILFMEHFLRNQQKYIDSFLAGEEMNPKLSDRLDLLNQGHMNIDLELKNNPELERYNFRTILEAAKEAGIKVIALEKDLSSYEVVKSGRDRILFFNAYAKKFIDTEMAKPERAQNKWLVFVGTGHVCKRFGVAGLTDLLPESQGLVILDSKYLGIDFFDSSSEPKLFAKDKDGFYSKNTLSVDSEAQITLDNFAETTKKLGKNDSVLANAIADRFVQNLTYDVGAEEDLLPPPSVRDKENSDDDSSDISEEFAKEESFDSAKAEVPTTREADLIYRSLYLQTIKPKRKLESSSSSSADETKFVALDPNRALTDADFVTPGFASGGIGGSRHATPNPATPNPATPNPAAQNPKMEERDKNFENEKE